MKNGRKVYDEPASAPHSVVMLAIDNRSSILSACIPSPAQCAIQCIGLTFNKIVIVRNCHERTTKL